jgi:hypothetical protein
MSRDLLFLLKLTTSKGAIAAKMVVSIVLMAMKEERAYSKNLLRSTRLFHS